MELEHLLAVQDGVVSRAQVLACGEGPNDVRRRGSGGPIVVCVDVRRTVRPVRGYRFVRVARLGECVDAAEVESALQRRSRVPNRREFTAVLTDVATGTCSALEHLFLTRVVRAHGLPEPVRQAPRVVVEDGGRHEYRDAEWVEQSLVIPGRHTNRAS